MGFKNLQLICKKYKQSETNCSKIILKKISLNTFSVPREEGQSNEMTLNGGFSVFKLLVVLSITKFYTHGITFSDICNFLIARILTCEMLLFAKRQTSCIDLCLSLLSD